MTRREYPKLSVLLLGLVCCLGCIAHAEDGTVPVFTISTVAGTGGPGFSGDGGPALEAQLDHPTAVALDSKGNLYIADTENRRVRKVDTRGIITTVAGTGEGRPQHEDVKAIATNLVQPYGIATDSRDRLYILNRGHSKLHRILPNGDAETIAGIGRRGYNGDGIPAREARLNGANHLVVDDTGTIFIADSGNQRIREIDSKGIITTIAGTGEAGYGGDNGPATEARFNFPSAIDLDSSGNLYVTDFANHRIRKIDQAGIVTTFAGTGDPDFNGDNIAATEANIGEPTGVAVDGQGNVYISDQVNDRIRVVIPDGTIHTVAGTGEPGYTGDGGPARDARIRIPDILCTDSEGNVYFPDHQNSVVRKLTRTGSRRPSP